MFILCLKDCTPWADSGNDTQFKAGTLFTVKPVNEGINKLRGWPDDSRFVGQVLSHALGNVDFADTALDVEYVFQPCHGRQTVVTGRRDRMMPWMVFMRRMLQRTVMHGITVTQVTQVDSKMQHSLHALDSFTIRSVERLARGSKPEYEATLWSNEQAYTIRFDRPEEILGEQ